MISAEAIEQVVRSWEHILNTPEECVLTGYTVGDLLADVHAALEAVMEQKAQADPAWCYLCDRPKNDCACEVEK